MIALMTRISIIALVTGRGGIYGGIYDGLENCYLCYAHGVFDPRAAEAFRINRGDRHQAKRAPGFYPSASNPSNTLSNTSSILQVPPLSNDTSSK